MAKTRTAQEFKQDRRNANRGTDRGRAMVEASLREVGAGRSILSDRAGNIIAGNKTLAAAESMGLKLRVIETDGKELVVVQRNDLDLTDDAGPARKMAYLDNRASEVGLAWDAEVLLADLNNGLSFDGLFDKAELDALLAGLVEPEPVQDPGPQIDKADELRVKWGIELGQLWQLGAHRLICGDCTDAATVDKLMQGEKADMVFTDPPYNVAGEGRNYAADAPTQKKTYEALKNAEWDKGFDILPALSSIESIMADDCAVYVCTSQFLVQKIWDWMAGWSKYNSYCVWCKPNPAPSLAKRHWTWATELIPYGVRGRHVCNFPESGHSLNWWQIVSPGHTTGHPTQKPTDVVIHAMEFSSGIDAIVADFFLGSGTTLIACEQLSRQCRAIEISPAYVAVALERFYLATNKLPVLISDA